MTTLRTLPEWVVVHDPDDYEFPDAFGAFPSRGDAEWWMERYVKHNNLDANDCSVQQLLVPGEYDIGNDESYFTMSEAESKAQVARELAE